MVYRVNIAGERIIFCRLFVRFGRAREILCRVLAYTIACLFSDNIVHVIALYKLL